MDTVHYLNERTHPPFPYDVILTIRHGTGFAHKAVDRSGQRLLRPFRKSGTGECRMLFRNVVIFGAGTMGHAIALRFARGGHAVTLTDVDRDALDRAERSIRRLAGTQSEQLGGEAPESVMARLRFAEDGFGAAAGA